VNVLLELQEKSKFRDSSIQRQQDNEKELTYSKLTEELGVLTE
jgi:hypothetical protein